MSHEKLATCLFGLGAWLLFACPAGAAEVPADPSDYQAKLAALVPGDTLVLAPGNYPRLLVSGLHGTAADWITIAGPEQGDPAVITAESCCNTVQLYDASFVAIRGLVVDVGGLYVDAINAKDSVSHDILIENNTLTGFPTDDQQIVGINTKSMAYNWTIRGNTIVAPGTGLYLGGSEGDAPFIAGVIEHNLVQRPLGYCMQIKHQNDYSAPPELTAGPHVTVIAHNVFIKDDSPSPSGDRPNLLVGGFPDAGAGADDRYEVYGNLLFANPREALFQATGRVSVHDNIFVGAASGWPALLFTSHQGKSVKLAYAYNNTIYGEGRGIVVSQAASQDDAIVGNLVFSPDPIAGAGLDVRDNVVDTVAAAANYVAMPATALGAMDFYPVTGAAVQGSALDLTKVVGDVDFDRDFNGTDKGALSFRGAYAGQGDNPGCPLQDAVNACGDDPGGESGTDTGGDSPGTEGDGSTPDGTAGAEGIGSEGGAGNAGGTASDGGAGTAGSGAGAADTDADGCGCRRGPGPSGATWLGLGLLFALGLRRGRVSA